MPTLDRDSDAFASEYENQTSQQYYKIDKFYPEFRKNIQQLFRLHSEEAKKSLALIFTNQDTINTYKNVPEFAYMYEIMQVYICERNSQSKVSILDTIDTIEDFVRLIERTKFILWRIEFFDDVEAKELLVELIKENNLSLYYFAEIIRTAAFTNNCYDKLLTLLNNHNMITLPYKTTERIRIEYGL